MTTNPRKRIRLVLDRSERSFRADLVRGKTKLATVVGFPQRTKLAAFKLETRKTQRRKGYATTLLQRVRRKIGVPIYPFHPSGSAEAHGFWLAWIQRQDRCTLAIAEAKLLYEIPELRSIPLGEVELEAY